MKRQEMGLKRIKTSLAAHKAFNVNTLKEGGQSIKTKSKGSDPRQVDPAGLLRDQRCQQLQLRAGKIDVAAPTDRLGSPYAARSRAAFPRSAPRRARDRSGPASSQDARSHAPAVKVQHQRLVSRQCERGRQIHGRRRLTDTTLLIQYRDPSHESPLHRLTWLRPIRVRGMAYQAVLTESVTTLVRYTTPNHGESSTSLALPGRSDGFMVRQYHMLEDKPCRCQCRLIVAGCEVRKLAAGGRQDGTRSPRTVA